MPMAADTMPQPEPKLLGPGLINFGTFSELEALRKAERAEKYKSYQSQYATGYSSGSVWRDGKWVKPEPEPAAIAISREDKDAVDREMSIACAWDPDGVPCGGTVCDTGDCSEGWGPDIEDVPPVDLLTAVVDEVIGQIKMYVAEVQSCAHKFEKSPDASTLDDLLDAADGLSGFILGITNGD